jgi:hypothetical protein
VALCREATSRRAIVWDYPFRLSTGWRRRRLIAHEAEQGTLEPVKPARAEGGSLRGVAAELNRRGISTPFWSALAFEYVRSACCGRSPAVVWFRRRFLRDTTGRFISQALPRASHRPPQYVGTGPVKRCLFAG